MMIIMIITLSYHSNNRTSTTNDSDNNTSFDSTNANDNDNANNTTTSNNKTITNNNHKPTEVDPIDTKRCLEGLNAETTLARPIIIIIIIYYD